MLNRVHPGAARGGILAAAVVACLGFTPCAAASVETIAVDPAELVQNGPAQKLGQTIVDVVAFDRERRSDRLLFVRLDNPAAIDDQDFSGFTTQERGDRIRKALTDLANGRPIPERPQPTKIADWIRAMESAAGRAGSRSGLDVLVVASDFRFEYDGAWESMTRTVPSLPCLGGTDQQTRLRRGRLPEDMNVALHLSETSARRLPPAAAAFLLLALDGEEAAPSDRRRVSGVRAPSCDDTTRLDLGAFRRGLSETANCEAIPVADALPAGTAVCSTFERTPPGPPKPTPPQPPPQPPQPPPQPPQPPPQPPQPPPQPPQPPPQPPQPPPQPPQPLPPPPDGTLGGWTFDRDTEAVARRADHGFRVEASASREAAILISATVATSCAVRPDPGVVRAARSVREAAVGTTSGRSDFAADLARGCHLVVLRLRPPAEGCWSEPAIVAGTLQIDVPNGRRRVVTFRRAVGLCAGDPDHFDVLTGIDVP